MDDIRAMRAFVALGNDVRFTVFRLLAPYGLEGLPAGVVAERVGLKPTAISFHLANMTAAGILTQRRMRRNLIYSVNEHFVQKMAAFLAATVSPSLLTFPERTLTLASIVVTPTPTVVAPVASCGAVADRLGEQSCDVANNRTRQMQV